MQVIVDTKNDKEEYKVSPTKERKQTKNTKAYRKKRKPGIKL